MKHSGPFGALLESNNKTTPGNSYYMALVQAGLVERSKAHSLSSNPA